MERYTDLTLIDMKGTVDGLPLPRALAEERTGCQCAVSCDQRTREEDALPWISMTWGSTATLSRLASLRFGPQSSRTGLDDPLRPRPCKLRIALASAFSVARGSALGP